MDPEVLQGLYPGNDIIFDQLIKQVLTSPTELVGGVWKLIMTLGIVYGLRLLRQMAKNV
jgi:hypothetical protein